MWKEALEAGKRLQKKVCGSVEQLEGLAGAQSEGSGSESLSETQCTLYVGNVPFWELWALGINADSFGL